MIKTICGLKGTGKTKSIINEANQTAATATGNVVFITDTKRYMFDLVRKVRFIDVNDFAIKGEGALVSFIKGIVAGNSDTQYIFIDGASRITNVNIEDTAEFYKALDMMRGDFGLKFILTVSADPNTLPDHIKKYD